MQKKFKIKKDINQPSAQKRLVETRKRPVTTGDRQLFAALVLYYTLFTNNIVNWS